MLFWKSAVLAMFVNTLPSLPYSFASEDAATLVAGVQLTLSVTPSNSPLSYTLCGTDKLNHLYVG